MKQTIKHYLKENQGVAFTILFFTFTMFFYAPLEVFLQNRSEFWCNLRMIWWIPTLISITGFILFFLVGSFIRSRKIKRVYSILSFAGGFCAYIQGNFLNMKLGLMDGRKIDWHELQPQFRLNLLLWLAIILIIAGVGIWKDIIVEKICRYISLLLVITQLVALISLMIPAIADGTLSKVEKEYCSTDNLYEVGEQENVIVIVLDSFDQNYMRKLVDEANPELEKLDGFTYFQNFSGLFRSTKYGIRSLLTGDTYINQKPYSEWLLELEEKGTFYDDLISQDYSIDLYSDEMFLLPPYVKEKVRNRQVAPVIMDGVRIKATELIYRLAGCKYLPDYFKCKLWLYGVEFEGFERYDSDHTVYNWYNSAFRDGIEKNGISVVDGKQYKFFHLYGAHEPYFTGKNLEDVPENWNVEDIPEGAMKAATLYIEELKKVGVYNQSTIIITSDHGSTHVPGIVSNSVFLVKRKGESGPIKINCAPVSAGDFGATIVDLLAGNTKYDNEISAFRVTEDMKRNRKYYGYLFTDAHTIYEEDGKYALVEYNVNNTDSSTPLFELSGVGYTTDGIRYNHSDYCKTCKDMDGPQTENNWLYWEHNVSGSLPRE